MDLLGTSLVLHHFLETRMALPHLFIMRKGLSPHVQLLTLRNAFLTIGMGSSIQEVGIHTMMAEELILENNHIKRLRNKDQITIHVIFKLRIRTTNFRLNNKEMLNKDPRIKGEHTMEKVHKTTWKKPATIFSPKNVTTTRIQRKKSDRRNYLLANIYLVLFTCLYFFLVLFTYYLYLLASIYLLLFTCIYLLGFHTIIWTE